MKDYLNQINTLLTSINDISPDRIVFVDSNQDEVYSIGIYSFETKKVRDVYIPPINVFGTSPRMEYVVNFLNGYLLGLVSLIGKQYNSVLRNRR